MIFFVKNTGKSGVNCSFPVLSRLESCFGCFVQSLNLILPQIIKSISPDIIAKPDGLQYVESLILRLLGSLLAIPSNTVNPSALGLNASTGQIIQDIEERIRRVFPHPLDKNAIKTANDAMTKYQKSHKRLKVSSSTNRLDPLRTLFDKFHSLLHKELFGGRKVLDGAVSAYVLAVIEYIATDVFQLSYNYVSNMKHNEIASQDIRVAMRADKWLMDIFYQDFDDGPPPSAGLHNQPFFDSGHDGEYGNVASSGLTYSEAVKDLIHEERRFFRDIKLIIKVFRDPLLQLLRLTNDEFVHQEMERIFGNIDDIYDFSNDFLGSLEDAVEVADNDDSPAIGTCFEEFAEGQEFDVFEKFAEIVMSYSSQMHLYTILNKPQVVNGLDQAMLSALRYGLPNLLMKLVYHCFLYFKTIDKLKNLTESTKDRESFEQAEGLLTVLRSKLEKFKREEYFMRFYGRTNRATAQMKITEIQRSIDGWDGKDIGQSCNEFFMDGPLSKVCLKNRVTERYAFLFDSLIVLCKPNNKRSAMSAVSSYRDRDDVPDWKYKEHFIIRNIEITDLENSNHDSSNSDHQSERSNFYLFNNSSQSGSANHSYSNSMDGQTNGPLSSPGFDQMTVTSMNSMMTLDSSMANLDTTSLAPSTYSTSTSALANTAFKLGSRNKTPIVLLAKSPEEKFLWMSQLTLLNTRSMLERILDSKLREEAKQHPLQLPHPSVYRFAIEDSESNILLEDKESNRNVPLIKGATLLKLIERLTYHKYGDPMLVRTFLTTYRSFCTSAELLKLLIERFEIPEPDFRSCMQAMHCANDELSSPTNVRPPSGSAIGGTNGGSGDFQDQDSPNNVATGPTSPISPTQSIASSSAPAMTSMDFNTFFDEQDEQAQKDYREMLKRFRKEYAEPVQFRVLNVIRHWIDNHYYDFERDAELLAALKRFLQDKFTSNRNMRKLRDLIQKVLDRKEAETQSQDAQTQSVNFYSKPPSIEWWLTKNEEEYDLLTVSCRGSLYLMFICQLFSVAPD